MDERPPNARLVSRLSWLLVLSLLPTLTFMGHWPTEVRFPGTGAYLSLGPVAAHAHGHAEGDESDHARHCHGDSAGCSEAPVTAGVAFGLMTAVVALALATALFFACHEAVRPRRAQRAVPPGTRPPRPVLLAA